MFICSHSYLILNSIYISTVFDHFQIENCICCVSVNYPRIENNNEYRLQTLIICYIPKKSISNLCHIHFSSPIFRQYLLFEMNPLIY